MSKQTKFIILSLVFVFGFFAGFYGGIPGGLGFGLAGACWFSLVAAIVLALIPSKDKSVALPSHKKRVSLLVVCGAFLVLLFFYLF